MRADLEISSQEQYHKRMIREVLSEKHYLEMHSNKGIEKPYREKEHKNGTGKRE